MKYLISGLVIVISTFIFIFLVSNILLPIFYTIPRLIKEKHQKNILKRIPITKILLPPLAFLIIVCIALFLSSRYLHSYITEIYIGLGLSIIMHLTRFGRANSDMDQDFRKYFKAYLREPNENQSQELKSKYYTSSHELRQLSKRAFEKYITKDYHSAIAIYDKILDLNPALVNELTMRAQCLEVLNYNLDAIDDYYTAISIDDSDGNLFGLLGLLYNKIGNLDKAEEFLKLSISKGWKMYEQNLKMFSLLSNADLKQAIIEKCHIPENLTRRNKKDFEDDLSEIDFNEFNSMLIKSIEGVNAGLALDPENEELKGLYNYFYSKLN